MTGGTCRRHDDVLLAVTAGRWPDNCAAELQSHVEGCADCREIVAVTSLLAQARRDAMEEASLPSAGQVWWRAQVRARAEARRAAERPMLIIQAVAAACLIGVLVATLTRLWPGLHQAGVLLHATTAQGDVGSAFLVAAGAWIVLAPIVLYLAFARE
jgi:anti-sigma factor RsiW